MVQSLTKIFFTGTALLSMTLVAQGDQAQASTVCANGCDYTSIQAAIDAAGDFETIVVSPGTYIENISFPSTMINLRSSNGPENTIIDGSNGTGLPVVSVSSFGSYQSLTGFTITNGNALQGGGIFVSQNSYLIASDCIITGNHAENGGGVYNTGFGISTFSDCVITDNTADVSGGGIFNDNGSIDFSNGVISNNSATTGAGGGVSISDLTADGHFDRCIMSGNSAGTSGGGIASWGAATLENSIINGNSAGTSGGGIASIDQDHTELYHCTISGNIAGGVGGGIVVTSEVAQVIGVNNILWSNSPDQISGAAESVPLRYSDIQGGWPDTNGTNINCDPQFVAQADFHITPSSCCIDAGDSTVVGIEYDFDGNVRPSGPGYDIGAYELFVCSDLDGDGMTDCAGDCNDNDPSIYLGAAELCDGLDNNCDGTVPVNETDADNDGFMSCQECNDANPSVYPGAAELCDGLDNNCDGTVPVNETDADNDGFMGCQECNDANSSVYPGAVEVCNNGIDDDCDGSADCADGECLDFCSQPQPEICNDGIDNDLDGKVDCADKKDCNKDPAC